MTDNLTDKHLHNAINQIRNINRERATLRDQFAMAALTGLLSDPELDCVSSEYAKCAYGYADMMLAAREEKK